MHYFSSHPATFGFQASLPPGNITLNSANKRTDQSLPDFQAGIGTAAHASLDVDQLTSHTRAVDMMASLQGSGGGVITASEVHELLGFMIFWMVLHLNRLVIHLIS